MIEPGGIPQYTGDFGKLATAVSKLRTYATGIRNHGQDVHSRFQATAGYYKAPEAEQLLSSTRPVMDTADTFASHIESLADALEIFAAEAKPPADRLKQLKLDAIEFVNSVEGDDHWPQDKHKVDRNQELVDGVSAARVAFQEAERRAANKIEAISPAACRPTWGVDDGTHGPGMYGESLDMLKSSENLPWGSPVEQTYARWSLGWWEHGAKSWAWDGLAKDSIGGGIDGIGTLIGFHGSEARAEAWEGLRRTVVGGYAYGMDLVGEGEHLSAWQRDSEVYAKEFGKQFVAYDMQKKDPARAHAVVFFNLITLASGPAAGLAKVGKGGTIAKAAGTVAKIGDVLDPLSGSLKAVRALSDLPKVSQVLGDLMDHFHIAKPKLPNSILDFDHRYRVDRDGQFIPVNADGTPNLSPPRQEPAGADLVSGERELAGVGAGGHVHGAAGHAGEGLQPHAGHRSLPEGDPARRGRSEGPGVGDASGRSGPPRAHSDHAGSGDGTHHSGSGHGSEAGAPHGMPEYIHSDEAGAAHHGAPGDDAAVHRPSDARGITPEVDPSRYRVDADDAAQAHTGPILPAQEAGLLAELSRAKMAPADQENVLRSLRKDPYGAGVADLVNRGHLRSVENYDGILDMCKKGPSRSDPHGSMVPAAYMALTQATELQERGVTHLGFEFGDKDTPWDLDVYTKSPHGDIDFGYQLKDVNSINRIKKVVPSALDQLEYDGMRHGVAVLDVHQPMSGLTPQVFASVERAAMRSGKTVLLRFEDGAITIPPEGPIFP